MDDDQGAKSRPLSQQETTAMLKAMEQKAEIEEQRNAVPRLEAELDQLTKSLTGCQSQIETLNGNVSELECKLKAKETKKALEWACYLVPLLFAIAFTAYLVHRGGAQTPTVAINYNVGEMIGGLLAGTGALVAGVAYASRRPHGE